MFHDSNSAESIPKPSETGPNPNPNPNPTPGPGLGEGEDDNNVVTNIFVSGNARVGYEGQKPDLTGLSIELWWSDGTYESVRGVDAAGKGIVTIPAVLWEAHTNTATGTGGVTTAMWTPITIYHKDSPSVNYGISLPGVRAIDNTKSEPVTNNFTGESVTFSGGLSVTGSVAEFYEDEALPALGTIRVTAWYHPITGNGLYAIVSGPSSFTLDENYVFTDYWQGFPKTAKGTGATAAKRYAYGINTSEKTGNIPATKGTGKGSFQGQAGANSLLGASRAGTVYFLISRAANLADHVKAESDSKFVVVPLGKLYNINHIDVVEYELTAKGLENDGLKYWFSDDTRFLGNNASLSTTGAVTNGTNNGLNNGINGTETGTPPVALSGRAYWEGVIQNSTVSFDVYYMGVTDTDSKNRDAKMLTRAFTLGNAQVASVPDFRVYEDDPTAVKLRLGYYGWENLQASNVPNQEQWLNYLNFTIPIARFTEAIRIERQDKTVKPKPIDQRPATGTTITQQLLDSIKASYKIEGIYEYDGPGNEGGFVYREVPQGRWQQTWFNTGDLRGYNEDGEAVVELEVTIRRDNALLAEGFAAYVGLEGTVEVNAIP